MNSARLYARVSKDEQVKKDLSIPAQLEKLKEYCRQEKIKIIDIYVDEGISAATINKRKDFCRLLDDIKPNEIILFTRLDRFSRDIFDANMVLKKLSGINATFKAISEEDIDVTTADGKFMFDLKVSLAERERKKTKERIADVFDHKVKEGTLLCGKVPFGYQNVDKRPVLHKTNSLIVKMIYDMYETHQSIGLVLNELTDYRPSFQTLSNILKDERYTGMYRNNPLFFPQIISVEQYNRVIQIRKTKNIKTTPTKKVYLFTGLLTCPNCGRNLTSCTGTWGGVGYGMYRCPKHKQDKNCSFKKSVGEPKLERYLLANLKTFIENYVTTFEVSKKVVSNINNSKKTISDTKSKIKKLQDMYLDGRIESDEYNKRYDSYINTIKKEESKNFDIKIDKNKYQNILSNDIEETYLQLTKENKRAFWRSIIERIELKNDALIKYNEEYIKIIFK